jgi:hypothetical protein
MVDCVIEAVDRWPDFARKAGVADARIQEIQKHQLTNI